jgi:glyoxylase-like metal-dependent hydrolase (beta-lactamase superfamily II)
LLEPIDLQFLGLPRAIGVYVLETADGLAIHDCGPATTLPTLERGLAERGLGLVDIRHILLSHIHFDHAGAAGAIVERNPGIRVWVSEVGAPHLVDPSRLEASARRLYGEEFDSLWGSLTPIPEANISLASGDAVGWEAFPTPGHASHHVCYFRDGTLLAGDACGVRLRPTSYPFPAAPPPDIDLEAWHVSLAAVRRHAPDRLALIHFGVVDDVEGHLDSVAVELDRLAELVRHGATVEEFRAEALLSEGGDAAVYEAAAPADQTWLGLRRYWVKRGELLEG